MGHERKTVVVLYLGFDESGDTIFNLLVAQPCARNFSDYACGHRIGGNSLPDRYSRFSLPKPVQRLLTLPKLHGDCSCIPYLANTFGSTPDASLIMIGICGLFFFIVGYARFKKELELQGSAAVGFELHGRCHMHTELLHYVVRNDTDGNGLPSGLG